ncbi:MAG: SDR family oxidoreductase, partial [Flavobacteriales bacterium]
MKVKAIGITGASGIIGSKICQNLLEKGYILHVLTRNPENF